MIINVNQELKWLSDNKFRWCGEYRRNGYHTPFPFITHKDVVICVNLTFDYSVWYEVYSNTLDLTDYKYSSQNLVDCLEWCNNEYGDIFSYYNYGDV